MTAITIQPRVDTALDELVFEAMVIPSSQVATQFADSRNVSRTT
jgi:hypothetical protein